MCLLGAGRSPGAGSQPQPSKGEGCWLGAEGRTCPSSCVVLPSGRIKKPVSLLWLKATPSFHLARGWGGSGVTQPAHAAACQPHGICRAGESVTHCTERPWTLLPFPPLFFFFPSPPFFLPLPLAGAACSRAGRQPEAAALRGGRGVVAGWPGCSRGSRSIAVVLGPPAPAKPRTTPAAPARGGGTAEGAAQPQSRRVFS